MEPQLSDDLYARFRDMLLARSGLHYPDRKRADLLHGLGMAMDAGGYESLEALYAAVAQDGAAWDLLLSHLTIGETYFFRNSAQFDALRQHIFPELLQRHGASRGLRIWSAGCATGEEPYSLAMTIVDMLPPGDPWYASILATDINPQFLARARAALYGEWSFRETPADLRARFWTPEDGRWRLRPEIRRMVAFARLNLAEPCYPSVTNGTCAIDLLVCRNVTIYFDEATTRQIAERFYSALAPGGWLIVGHSEPQASVYHQFEVHNFPHTVLYRKPLDAPIFGFESWKPAQSERSETSARSEPTRTTSASEMRVRAGTRPLSSSALTGARPGTRPLNPTALPEKRPGTRPLSSPLAGALPATQTMRSSTFPMADRSTTSEIADLLARGRQCADRGDFAAGEACCADALARDALCIEAHYLLAQIHESQGQLDAALAGYRRTVYLDRGFVPGLIGMGNIWRQMGRATEARRYYQNALKQLALLPASTAVPGADGATAADLTALVGRQMQAVGQV